MPGGCSPLPADILLNIVPYITEPLPLAYTGKLAGKLPDERAYFESIQQLKSLSRVSRLYRDVFKPALWSHAYVRVGSKGKCRKLATDFEALLRGCVRNISFEHTHAKRAVRAGDILAVLQLADKLDSLHITACCTSKWRGPVYSEIKKKGNLGTVKRFTLALTGYEERLSFVTAALELVPNINFCDLYFLGGLTLDKPNRFVHLSKLRELNLHGFDIVRDRNGKDDLVCLLSRDTIKGLTKVTTDIVDSLLGEVDSRNPPNFQKLDSLVVFDPLNPLILLGAMPMHVHTFNSITNLRELDLTGVFGAVDCLRFQIEEMPRNIKVFRSGTQCSHLFTHTVDEFIQAHEGKSLEELFLIATPVNADYFAWDKKALQQRIDQLWVRAKLKCTIEFPVIVDRGRLPEARRLIPSFDPARADDIDLYDAFTGTLHKTVKMVPRIK